MFTTSAAIVFVVGVVPSTSIPTMGRVLEVLGSYPATEPMACACALESRIEPGVGEMSTRGV